VLASADSAGSRGNRGGAASTKKGINSANGDAGSGQKKLAKLDFKAFVKVTQDALALGGNGGDGGNSFVFIKKIKGPLETGAGDLIFTIASTGGNGGAGGDATATNTATTSLTQASDTILSPDPVPVAA
jgi:hypothetical protein